MMNYTFVSATILLVLILDPFGNIPIFANALRNVPLQRRPKVILREVLIAFVLLLAFMFMVNMVMAMTALPAFAVWLERLFPRRGPVYAPGLLQH